MFLFGGAIGQLTAHLFSGRLERGATLRGGIKPRQAVEASKTTRSLKPKERLGSCASGAALARKQKGGNTGKKK